MTDECRCEHVSKGVLRHSAEGEGLALYCAVCDGWVEDAWLFTDEGGIPVSVETAESQDYVSGEILTYYGLATPIR